jgi:hypothetical protein
VTIKFGKSEIKAMASVIDGEYESVDQAAEAVLQAATELFENRAKFVVVGQLSGTKERLNIPADDPEAIKVSLGWYSTEGDARNAAESLWHNTASGDTFRVWVLPMFHGTPADLHRSQREKYEKEASKSQEKDRLRLLKQIEDRDREAEARAKAHAKGRCVTCDHFAYDHRAVGNGRASCGLNGCDCAQWKERTKNG